MTGINRTLLGLGIGAGVASVAGAVAWAATRGSDTARTSTPVGPLPSPTPGPAPSPVNDAYDPGSVHSSLPTEAQGPGDLAVAWWPQDLSLASHGTDATLRFQSTIANIGGAPITVRPGDRIEYSVSRQDNTGTIGEVVGRGSAPLTAGDLEPFPVAEGTEIGHGIETYGTELAPVSSLAPQTASIIGAQHASQTIELHDASKGLYVLRQQIVHADGSADASSFNDARLTELILDGDGGMLHASSRYAGDR